MRQLPSAWADLIYLDPPFNSSAAWKLGRALRRVEVVHPRKRDRHDNQPDGLELLRAWSRQTTTEPSQHA